LTGPAEPLREQRLVFGEVADVYDRQRPTYPPQVVGAILGFAGIEHDSTTPVAEIGAGTGKASVMFAAHGINLLCIEPSPAMAAIARRNLAQIRTAEVLESSFEGWRNEPHAYGLLYAAQSWHWITPDVRYQKAHAALGSGGTLAVFWNVMISHSSAGLDRDLSVAYGDLFPNSTWLSTSAERAEANNWVLTEIQDSGLFGEVTIVRRAFRRAYPTDDWLELLSTQSDHRMLDHSVRDNLIERVRSAVDLNGGLVDAEYLTVAYLTRARDFAANPRTTP
jgi:hypothetical protein